MLTCKDCVFNNSDIDQNTKQLRYVCTRNPPTMHLIGTTQGLIANVAYPVISNDFTACGEYFNGIEDSEETEH